MFNRCLLKFSLLGLIYLFVPILIWAEDNPQNLNSLGNNLVDNNQTIYSVFEESDAIVVNNNKDLIVKFNPEDNEVWQNDTKIVRSERWIFEKYDEEKDRWEKIGKIKDKNWDQIELNQSIIKKNFEDDKTNYQLSYEFFEDNNPKISFETEIKEAGIYRIEWQIDGIKKKSVENLPEENRIIFYNDGEDKKLVFDYEDVKKGLGEITDVEIKGEENNYQLNLLFKVGRLEEGEFVLDPSFGYSTAGTSTTSIENSIVGSIFTIPEDGIADSISAYIGVTTRAKLMKTAIYRHSDLSLVGSTEEKSVGIGTTWQTFNFTGTKPNLKANTEYLLVAWSENTTGNGTLYYSAGVSNQRHTISQNYSSWPSTLGTVTHGTQEYSIFCNYTTAQISLTLSDGMIDFGFLGAGTSKATISSELNDTQEITNTGNTSETFTIRGADTACPWTLSSSVGINQYVYEFCNTGNGAIDPCDSSPTWTKLTSNYQTLATNVAKTTTSRFDLRLNMPTQSSCLNEQSPQLTIMAEIN